MTKPILSKLTEEVIERFWSKVDTGNDEECWEWKAGKSKGYGTIKIDSVYFTSSRVSWTIANNKDIPEGMFACHSCDNPKCCNPKHIFIGSHQDNMNDMTSKGRGKGSVDTRKGEDSNFSVLTQAEVLEIRSKYALNKMTQSKLAKEYNVARSTIGHIITRNTWKHI